MHLFDLTAERGRLGLAPDCPSCFGLCCVAHAFRASASFAFDKPAGEPCPNLLADFGCAIHRTLRQQGFSGCTAYTCYGAGQKVAQHTFRGTDWRQAPETAELMFQAFPIVRQLNQLLWFISEALDRCSPGADFDELLHLLHETERLAATPADEMSWGDVDDHCLRGEALLRQVSAAVRAAASSAERERPAVQSASGDLQEALRLETDRHGSDWRRADLRGADVRGAGLRGADLRGPELRGPELRGPDLRSPDLRGSDLRGADLRGADLRGADLWGAVLSSADLSGADLRWADLMGADLGLANLAGADISAAMFLTQSQLELAHGNARTTLSGPLRTPAHWSGADDDLAHLPDNLGIVPEPPTSV